jgi:hypothetical protein
MDEEPDMNNEQLGKRIDYMSTRLSDDPERIESLKHQAQLGAKAKANDRQEGGDHYQNKAIQPWDYIISNNIGYLEGNIIKYVSRYKEKHGLEDLKKARHYLDKLIEEISK